MAHLALCPGHPPIFHTFYHSHYCKLGGGMGTMLKLVHNCFKISLIPRPSACPADLWKNRVWTLSLQKLGQVYLQWSSATSSICFGSLWWCIAQFTLPEQSDWCDNMPICSCNYTPVLLVNVSRPYFLTRPQVVRKKNWCLGRRLLQHNIPLYTVVIIGLVCVMQLNSRMTG